MRAKLIFIYAFMLFASMNAQNAVEKLVVYKKFYRAGTTARISSAFEHPVECLVDTTNINSQNVFLNEFNLILSKSKSRKHYQHKMSDISMAGVFLLDSVAHHFIICFPNMLVDLTEKKEYKITDELLLSKLHTWMNGLERTLYPLE